jgi:hypothetical protein
MVVANNKIDETKNAGKSTTISMATLYGDNCTTLPYIDPEDDNMGSY